MTGGLAADTALTRLGSEQTALQVIDAVAQGGRAMLAAVARGVIVFN